MIDTAIVDAFKQRHAHFADRERVHAEHEANFRRELEALCKLASYQFEAVYNCPGVFAIIDPDECARMSGTLVELANALL